MPSSLRTSLTHPLRIDELHTLGVPQLGEAVRARSMAWHHLPIPDLQAPGAAFAALAAQPMRQAIESLKAGHKVLVHCRGGLGRAGTIAASLLIELGDEAGIALQRVRKARPGAVETSVQERYLRTYQRWVNT